MSAIERLVVCLMVLGGIKSTTVDVDHVSDDIVIEDLKDLLHTSMNNIVSLNDLVTELTKRIAELTLSMTDSKAESKMAKTEMEELKRVVTTLNDELKDLKKPRNGVWADYGNWSHCSAECGEGTQIRTRTCSNPAPANGGADCQGEFVERRECNMDPCPLNGGWTNWEEWSLCSVPCGGVGTQTKTRTCTDPAPAHGGAACSGTNEETRSCNSGMCGNIAQLGTATQVDVGFGGLANRAIDGRAEGFFDHGSVTSTSSRGRSAWWTLTFSQPMYIDAIHVYGRTDCCHSRIDGASLSIDGRIVGTLDHSRGFPNRFTNIRKIGSRITITASGSPTNDNYLQLAEVVVYGTFDASN